MAEGEFINIAEEVIDDDLTLLLSRSDGIPRLGIYNTYNDKKKYVPLSWIEGAGRSLKIKVGKQTKEYSMNHIVEGVCALVSHGSDALSLNSLAWRGVQILGDLLHMPKTARSDADLNLIAENKRDTLWFVYTPKKGKWRVRPCFVPTENERKILDANLEDDKPWPALLLENGSLPYTMRNIPLVKEISLATPARWSECMLALAKGILLGFSDWSSGGEHTFGNALWKQIGSPKYRSEETLDTLQTAGRPFLTKMIAYLRLWPVLENVQIEKIPDSTKTGEERGLKKRERFEMVSSHLGDKRFKVTRFVDEENTVAFGIVPETRLPGEDDRLITLTLDAWEQCLDACSLGGEKDPQYTCNSILGGIETKDWYQRIHQCLFGQEMQEPDAMGRQPEDGDENS